LQQLGAPQILAIAIDTVPDIALGIIMAVAVTTAETPIAEALRGEVEAGAVNSG